MLRRDNQEVEPELAALGADSDVFCWLEPCGWHYQLNQRAQGGTLNVYKLFGLLHKEAKMVMVTQRLLSDHKVRRSGMICHRQARTSYAAADRPHTIFY